MSAMTVNDWVQCAAVIVLLVLCVVWIVGRVRRRGTDCDSASEECEGCALAQACKSKRKETKGEKSNDKA